MSRAGFSPKQVGSSDSSRTPSDIVQASVQLNLLAPSFFRQFTWFVERHAGNKPQWNTETIPGVAAFAFAYQRAFSN
jgi:hypothetical protein